MTQYILKRVLILIPTLIFVSIATFILIRVSPGDPVETSFSDESGRTVINAIPQSTYIKKRRELGLDLPYFYFSMGNSAVADTLQKVAYPHHRNFLKKTATYYGSWAKTVALFKVLTQIETDLRIASMNSEELKKIKHLVSDAYAWKTEKTLKESLSAILLITAQSTDLKKHAVILKRAINEINSNKNSLARFIPKLHWHGSYNQYHTWIFGNNQWPAQLISQRKIQYGIFKGDFGISYRYGISVGKIIGQALPITLALSLISFVFFNVIGITLGFIMALAQNTYIKHSIKIFLTTAFSIPSYWLALLGIVFFCNPDFFNWFPSSYSSIELHQSLTSNIGSYIYFLILPATCIILGNIPFIGFQVQSESLNVIKSGYLLTARAKGLNNNKIFRRHILRNVLLPIITFSSRSILLAVTGSITIEIIFSIRGIGTIIYEALLSADHPIIFSTTLIICSSSIVIFILADILYSIADPRIKYGKHF